jgi:hypothetical protein
MSSTCLIWSLYILNKLPVTTEIQNQNATYAGNTGVVADAFRTFL